MKTRKIKDFKDFMECLRAGKKVKDSYDSFYTLQEGLLCETDETGTCYGTVVRSQDFEDMTVEEPEELKIEVGKLYKTRDGRKAFVFFFDKSIRDYHIGVKDVPFSYYVNSYGLYNRKTGELTDNDLVAEWED